MGLLNDVGSSNLLSFSVISCWCVIVIPDNGIIGVKFDYDIAVTEHHPMGGFRRRSGPRVLNNIVSLEFPYPPPQPWPVFPVDLEHNELWVFGYGSLMWNPGFPFTESATGRLYGYHRDLCVWSWNYRGNRQTPGLVLGLDHGGSCTGVSYRIDNNDRGAVLAYLHHRELNTEIYDVVCSPVMLDTGRKVTALCFVVDRKKEQYTGRLSLGEVTRIVKSARGQRGENTEYVVNTYNHLQDLGVRCRRLQEIVKGLDDH